MASLVCSVRTPCSCVLLCCSLLTSPPTTLLVIRLWRHELHLCRCRHCYLVAALPYLCTNMSASSCLISLLPSPSHSIAYTILNKDDPLAVAVALLEGFATEYTLSKDVCDAHLCYRALSAVSLTRLLPPFGTGYGCAAHTRGLSLGVLRHHGHLLLLQGSRQRVPAGALQAGMDQLETVACIGSHNTGDCSSRCCCCRCCTFELAEAH